MLLDALHLSLPAPRSESGDHSWIWSSSYGERAASWYCGRWEGGWSACRLAQRSGVRAEDSDAVAHAFKPVLPDMLGALAVKANSDPDVSLLLCSL